jgi:hypothetical protein
MNILSGLTFTLAISIGVIAFALSGDTKGRVKGDISVQTENYTRGRSYCLINCDQNYSDGTGNYIAYTYGRFIQTRIKDYKNGATSVDAVISGKACDEDRFVCVTGAFSKRLADNYDKKEEFSPHHWPLNGNSPRPTEISSNLLSSPEINGQSTSLRPALGQTRFPTSLSTTSLSLSAAQSKRNEGTKKLGKQIYRQLEAIDPILLAASKISSP